MNWWELIAWCIIAMFVAFVVERSCHAVKRRLKGGANRYAILEQTLADQKKLLQAILSRESISYGMKKFILVLSVSAASEEASHRFAAWLDRGEAKPSELPCAKLLIREWQRIKQGDPTAADSILAFANRTSLVMLLLWNENFRSLGWLYFDMTAESPWRSLTYVEGATVQTTDEPRLDVAAEGSLLSLAMIEEAAAQTTDGPRAMESLEAV